MKKQNLNPKSAFLFSLLKSQNNKNIDFNRALLLDANFDSKLNKVYLIFYNLDNNKTVIWFDNTNYKAYCYSKFQLDYLRTKTNLNGLYQFDYAKRVKKINSFSNKPITLTKIYTKSPYGRTGKENSIESVIGRCNESDVRHHLSYLYDNKLIIGMIYRCREGKLIKLKKKIKIPIDINKLFEHESSEFKDFAKRNIDIFFQPIPKVNKLAFDIEVEVDSDGTFPDVDKAEQRIISCSFVSDDNLKVVVVLKRNSENTNYSSDCDVEWYGSEINMIKQIFKYLKQYSINVSFNGDNFDLPYLYNRAIKLGISAYDIPFFIQRGWGFFNKYEAYMKNGLHIDIRNFYSNKSIKTYAYQNKYDRNSLDSISKALLDNSKIEHEEEIDQMTYENLIKYNLQDSVLTLELVNFNNHMTWNLMILMCRISRLPISDMLRHQLSYWIKSILLCEHRERNILIPRRSEITKRIKGVATEAIIKGKKYMGAIVIEPEAGRHYDVVVMDFASLYPSVIKEYNLSYETINCGHKLCKKNKLPELPYYSCLERQGILSYTVGFIKDIRVRHFKNMKDESSTNIQQALKVFINGSYGVFGSDDFDFFCVAVAESTTGISRFSIKKSIEKAKNMDISIIYGDTDSIFLKNYTNKQIKEIEDWSRSELSLELDKEKTFVFIALSKRKKNYIGIKDDGKLEIKGLAAKKRNTPEFVKKIFENVKNIVKVITCEQDFIRSRQSFINIAKAGTKKIGNPKAYNIEDYAINIAIGMDIKNYKTLPQHIRAIQKYKYELNKTYTKNDIIKIIKSNDNLGAKPLSLSTLRDVNIKKYKEILRSVLEQVYDALGIDWSEIQGIKKLDSFM